MIMSEKIWLNNHPPCLCKTGCGVKNCRCGEIEYCDHCQYIRSEIPRCGLQNSQRKTVKDFEAKTPSIFVLVSGEK